LHDILLQLGTMSRLLSVLVAVTFVRGITVQFNAAIEAVNS